MNELTRRRFVGLAGRAAVAGGASWSVGGADRALERLLTSFVPPSTERRLAGRAFNIVVLGDSIAWGQGLEPAQKYPTLVRQWIQSAFTGPPVPRVYSYAHSGAVILADAARDLEPAKHGEVPNEWPSITAQIDIARSDLVNYRGIAPEAVDLVLMDGGINDVNVRRILNPDPTVGADWVQRQTEERCNRRLGPLLEAVVGQSGFPNAKVVVTNYFPVVSAQSDLTGIGILLAALGLGAGGALSVVAGIPGLSILAAAAIPATPWLRDKLAAQSQAFHQTSTRGCQEAVARANRLRESSAVFVDVGFGASQAYAAPDSHLFLVLEQGSMVTSTAATPVVGTRAAACRAAGEPLNPTCLDASMGHPNVKGAQRYARAIMGALTQVYPQCV